MRSSTSFPASSSITFRSGSSSSPSTVLLCRPTDVTTTTVQGHNQVIPMTNTASNPNLITSQNSSMHSDHYQYLRTLLPPIPHVIERLSFTDLNSWGCSINLALLTSTDCLKWLAEFQDITKTEWKVEKNLSTNTASSGSNVPNISWGVIYRCDPSSRRSNTNTNHVNPNYSKECTARLEMKITNQQHHHQPQLHQDQQHPVKTNKQYPCTVNIHFYHNHKTVTSFPSSSSFTTTYSLPSSSSVQQRELSVHGANIIIPSSTTTTSSHVFNNGMVNHQDVVDSTSDNRTNLSLQQRQLQHTTNEQPLNNINASTTNPTTTSYSHIQELKMNDTYMVNALTEAAVATRAAVAAKSVQQPQRHNLQTRINTNGSILKSNASLSPQVVSNHYVSNAQPSNQQQVAPINPSSINPVLTVPSHVCNTATNTQTVAPTQNSIYLSIACGDERTRHRFCLVVQMMCSLLQKNGQSADAINQFTERFKYLKEQADLSPQNEEAFLKALFNFGNTTEVQPNNHTIHTQSVDVNNSSQSNINTPGNQTIAPDRATNPPENISAQKPGSLPISRKRRSSARRIRCGSCDGCINHNRTRDCRACRNCLDQKRYGGPGKLKKACLKRLCLVLSSTNLTPTSQSTAQPLSSLPNSSTISTVSIPNNLPLDVPLPQHPMPISSLNGALTPGSSTLVGQIKRVELQVHHQPALLQQRQEQQPNTPVTNNIQHVDNNTAIRQHVQGNSVQNNIAQGHRPPMPIITMPQPNCQGPQVQNITTCYQSSLPSTSHQAGQNVQAMHVTQPTTYNGQ